MPALLAQPPWLLPSLLLLAAYLCGAVPWGLIVGLARGVDVRQSGSHNIGATNVARTVGKKWGLLTLALDMLKGLGPVLVVQHVLAADPRAALWTAAAMVAAVLGHMFPVFLRFRGGKGVATGLGVMLAVAPWAGAAGLALYVGLYALLRISSVGSLAGAAVAPVVMALGPTPLEPCLAAGLAALLVVVRHRENIRRLLRGEEGKV